MFRGNKHPFTHSRVDNNLTGHDENGELHLKPNSSLVRPNHAPSCHRRPSTAQINQRIPLRNAKQQTNIPPRNERTSRKLASLTSAKRSVVTSDAAGTHSSSSEVHSELLADELRSTKRTDTTTQVQIPQPTRQILGDLELLSVLCCEIRPFVGVPATVSPALLLSNKKFGTHGTTPKGNSYITSSTLTDNQ